jgi:multiple sugar transport system ATP-binding protein
MNFITAEVATKSGNDYALNLPGGKTATVTSRGGTASGTGVEIGVRPEHLKLGPAGAPGSSFDGAVSIVEQLGNSTLLYVDTPSGTLIVEAEGNLKIAVGDKVALTVDHAQSHLFGSDGKVV